MSKRLAILQSNYIPWKGYFDLIAFVDNFIIYDDAQFTKNDWRNRNKIKTPQGAQWLSVPVGKNIHRRIRDVYFADRQWLLKHWKSIEANYKRAPYFDEVSALFEPVYKDCKHDRLSPLNRELIEIICEYLGVTTKINYSWDYSYDVTKGKTERLVDLCVQADCVEYVSGPSARSYIDVRLFAEQGITISWFAYDNYPVYPQLWGSFVHDVTILDLLFNCGRDAPQYMKYIGRR